MLAYIGVGSNLGEPAQNIEKAKTLLASASGITFIRSSSIYETEPWGVKDQPKFANAVWVIETSLKPIDLFLALKEIENTMGRKKILRYGPRIIDLDILFYDKIIYQDTNITIPHPKIQDRSFVLFPLSELAGEFIHPLFNVSITTLKNNLKDLLGIKTLKN